jgi:hypothetical protein
MQYNVIQASERFITPRPTTPTKTTASVIRADFGPKPEIHRNKLPASLKSLPFVEMKVGRRRASAAGFWTDAPTGNGRDDFKRGQRYAALTIAAMTADGCVSWYLEKIIEGIVSDAASRKAKGGKYSRALPPAVVGFIHELSRQYCAGITGNQL